MSIGHLSHNWEDAPQNMPPDELLALLYLSDAAEPEQGLIPGLDIAKFQRKIHGSESQAIKILQSLLERELVAAYQDDNGGQMLYVACGLVGREQDGSNPQPKWPEVQIFLGIAYRRIYNLAEVNPYALGWESTFGEE